MKRVAILMGSERDLPVMEKACTVLKELSIPFDVHVLSAHRTPSQTATFARDAAKNGYAVLIAGAGMAAHLGGVLASHTLLPVIAVPLSATLGGMDALLSCVQMPTGIPVATVAIDGSANAALLAAQILALSNEQLAKQLAKRRKQGEEIAMDTNERIKRSFTL
ncbi:MAG: 5-(carboxyamino)imidazole ribonucleotide mutase [Sphaerochaetaceae bacterium]|jgi:5-(carboxyamino)imidazole ribonucleotide mutase|nr:5-(carboxyamino)imidazole ribonucleotide mutase [Sphaerochaetaceae bacterium]MDY0372454.1 5-(carboxyamino)imidazole ribonucleotide mutase [Sphaerochaetaceae bacterium]